jgi:hypothetical protein
MANMFCVRDPARALLYVRSQLECGGSLFRRVHGTIDTGSLYGIVPDAIPQEVLAHAFDSGLALKSGSVVHGVRPTDAACEVFESLSGGSDWLVVADAHHLAPEYPATQRTHLAVRTSGPDVYFVGSVTKGRDYLRSLILHGSSAWYGATMLVGSRIADTLTARACWDEDDLSTVASDMKALLVCAYDQQGYVLWLSPECTFTASQS